MIGKILKHELRKVWKNEAKDFTTWLESNLNVVAEAVGFDINLVKREQAVGPFSADILATDENGKK